jgi:hypothetical protein
MRLTHEKKERIAMYAAHSIINGVKSVIEFRKTHPSAGIPAVPFFNAFERGGALYSDRARQYRETIYFAFGDTIGKSFGIDEMPELSDGQIKEISRLTRGEASERWRHLLRKETDWCIEALRLWTERGSIDADTDPNFPFYPTTTKRPRRGAQEDNMARKSRVTFSKMVQDTEGGGDITVYVDGKRRGWIEKESDAIDVGVLECSYVYKASNYVAVVWEKNSAFGDDRQKNFAVSDYSGPRAALAAAKQWARDTLLSELDGAVRLTPGWARPPVL